MDKTRFSANKIRFRTFYVDWSRKFLALKIEKKPFMENPSGLICGNMNHFSLKSDNRTKLFEFGS